MKEIEKLDFDELKCYPKSYNYNIKAISRRDKKTGEIMGEEKYNFEMALLCQDFPKAFSLFIDHGDRTWVRMLLNRLGDLHYANDYLYKLIYKLSDELSEYKLKPPTPRVGTRWLNTDENLEYELKWVVVTNHNLKINTEEE